MTFSRASSRLKAFRLILLAAAKKVFSEWPTPLVTSGFEIGQAIKYPATSIERDFGYLRHHPLREAGGNQTKAAQRLGISRDTLRYRLKKFGLHP